MINVRIQVQVNDIEYEITERDPISTFGRLGENDVAILMMNKCMSKIAAAIVAK